jgi:hypothetical protein
MISIDQIFAELLCDRKHAIDQQKYDRFVSAWNDIPYNDKIVLMQNVKDYLDPITGIQSVIE